MKTLNFSLSDYGSLQRELITKFDFIEKTYNFFESKDHTRNSFFRRIMMDSGFEIWILSGYFPEATLLKQVKSNNMFYATHFSNYDGVFYDSEIQKDEIPSKGIYSTNGNAEITFKVNKFEKINFVSFVYSKRWLDANLLGSTHYTSLFNNRFVIKKHHFQTDIEFMMTDIIQMAKINNPVFLLRLNLYAILKNYLDFIANHSPVYVLKQPCIISSIEQVEELLTKDFSVTMNDIYEEMKNNGFDKKDIVSLFKERNGVGLLEYRIAQRMKIALNLLKDGDYKVSEVAENVGFKSVSKFIEFFKRNYGITPLKLTKKRK